MSEPIKIRNVSAESTTLEELESKSLGLYFPIEHLSAEDKKKMEKFLADLDYEPIAISHSKATDD